jgi:hypothetical protein
MEFVREIVGKVVLSAQLKLSVRNVQSVSFLNRTYVNLAPLNAMNVQVLQIVKNAHKDIILLHLQRAHVRARLPA